MNSTAKADLPVRDMAIWDNADETTELVSDAVLMAHFEAGVRDLHAGRYISADDLEIDDRVPNLHEAIRESP